MKINKEFVIREIAGECVIVPTGKTVLDFNGLIVVNETAQFIWEQLQEETDEDTLVKKLLEEYEVTEEEARSDVKEFIEKLIEGNILDN